MKWIQRCAALAMVLGLAACGGSENDSSPPNAAIRISHLAPDAPKVNVNVDGAPFLTAVDYGSCVFPRMAIAQ